MKQFSDLIKLSSLLLILSLSPLLKGQSYLIGPSSPSIGASANFTALIQFLQFDVLNSSGVIIDSVDLYPFSAAVGSPFTIVVQNSSQTVIASYNGTTTVTGGTTPQRIKVNFNIPQGTGYRWGFSVNPGMCRNSTGGVYPYTVPGLMSITGNTFNVVYYYFFYNIRIQNPTSPGDAGITAFTNLSDTMCGGTKPVQARLKNFGSSAITSAQLNWKVNGVSQTTLAWTGNLLANDSVIVNLGNYNFVAGSPYSVQAFSSMPNNVADLVPANDSASRSISLVKPSPTATPTSTAYSMCQGDTISVGGTLTGTPPFSITVFDGSITQTFSNIPVPIFLQQISPSTTTTITVTGVSDATGCVYTGTPPIVVTVAPSPTVSVTPAGPTTFCQGDSVVLLGYYASNYAYTWKESGAIIGGANSANYTAVSSGQYTLTSTLGNCFRTSLPVTVTVKPLPSFNLGNDTNICAHRTITLSAGSGNTSYLWSTGAVTPSVIIDSSGVGLGTKPVSVLVTLNGCSAADSVNITFVNCTGIGDIETANAISVYPNPCQDKAMLMNLRADQPTEATLYSSTGSAVRSWNFEANYNGEYKLDLDQLVDGIYFIKIYNGKLLETKKLIISH